MTDPFSRIEELALQYPLGTLMRKGGGAEWDSRVVGYYSSTLTPAGLVLESVADGSRYQVHVEPAKRMVKKDKDA